MIRPSPMFDYYRTHWNLTPDGDPLVASGARLFPVLWRGKAAMLKIAANPEERRGGAVLDWWNGRGAARVFKMDGDAVLLERACGGRSLPQLARAGRDDDATRIICGVAAELHAPRTRPLPRLTPLSERFGRLESVASNSGGVFADCAATARGLLTDPQEVVVLHGDIHHGNVLDFGGRGWLAIDPKGLFGERGFDYANLFCNPAFGDPSRQFAALSDRFAQRLKIVVETSGVDRRRLLRWIVAWAGLSAAWLIDDDHCPETNMRLAELALAEISR